MIYCFMLKNKISKQYPKLSIPDIILMALNKVVNAPFEILLEYGKTRNQLRPTIVRTALHRLKYKKLVYCERQRGKIIFALTEDGEKAAEKIKYKLGKNKPKKWDGKWRVIVFDVPEKLRGKRDLLRRELNNFGFMQLQRSVWVYPHPLPKEFIDLWKAADIFKHCVIFEADKMENGEELKRFFQNIIAKA